MADIRLSVCSLCFPIIGKNIEVKNHGTGGLAEFKSNLGEGLAWGGFKCTAVDNREVGLRCCFHSRGDFATN